MARGFHKNRVVVHGAGEMASGVIHRLHSSGFEVIALERPKPECVRRTVCFAEAVFTGEMTVEGVTARLVKSMDDIPSAIASGYIPIVTDPEAESLADLRPFVLIDGRMLKTDIDTTPDLAPIVIGLGPGFVTGQNCHAAVETNRGPNLGQVIYNGSPQADTGIPAPVNGIDSQRVIRAPADGIFHSSRQIGDNILEGEIYGEVAGHQIPSPITGIVRGLIRNGSSVITKQKIGDIDPCGVEEYCYRISSKANAIAEGVQKAIKELSSTHERSGGRGL